MKFSWSKAVFWCLAAAVIASSLAMLRGAFLTPESLDFIANYSAQRPFGEKIFDVYHNDYNFYQARELSYVFDFLDVSFIRACARAGFPHFYSATYYAALILIVWLFLFFMQRLFPEAPKSLMYLLALLFLTSPVVFFSGFFYRSAKILATASLMLLAGCVLWAGKKKPGPAKAFALVFFAALPPPFFDRQGFFLLLVLGALSLAYGAARRERFWAGCVAAPVFSSALVHCLYNYRIGPWLVFHFSGRHADFSYQRLSLSGYFARFPAYLKAGGAIFFDNVSQVFGNFGPWWGFLAFVLCAAAVARKNGAGLLVFLLAAALMVLMDSLMVLRLPTITWEETRLVYVWLPQTGAVLLVAALALAPKARRLALVLLLACLAGNLAALPRHWRTIQSGQLDFFIQAAPSIRACIKDAQTPAVQFAVNTPGKDLSEDYVARARHACALLRR